MCFLLREREIESKLTWYIIERRKKREEGGE
jgi:hypothetical protein